MPENIDGKLGYYFFARVDTFESDPISSFKLSSDDFITYGSRIGAIALPTVYVMEGGYAVEEIGPNTVNVLSGHLN